MKTEMLWANWKVESKSPVMEHGFLSQNTLDHEKLFSWSAVLPDKFLRSKVLAQNIF